MEVTPIAVEQKPPPPRAADRVRRVLEQAGHAGRTRAELMVAADASHATVARALARLDVASTRTGLNGALVWRLTGFDTEEATT